MGFYAALDQFSKHFPKNTSITADSWFGMKSWIMLNYNIPITCSMSNNQGGELCELFGHGLKYGEYRTFWNKKMFVTVFHDEKI